MMRIDIKGAIIDDSEQWIYDWFDVPATSPNKVINLLKKADEEDVEIVINSGGGSVYAGAEIYSELKSYKGNVDVKIMSMAASAASVIAMAGNKVFISPVANLMIHNASGGSWGDHRDMSKSAEILKTIDTSIANAYELKTGKKHSELLNLMGDETWMDAKKAIELGFVDEVLFDEGQKFVNQSTNSDGTLPKSVIEKTRNMLKKIDSEKKVEEKQEFKNSAIIEKDDKIDVAKAKAKALLELLN